MRVILVVCLALLFALVRVDAELRLDHGEIANDAATSWFQANHGERLTPREVALREAKNPGLAGMRCVSADCIRQEFGQKPRPCGHDSHPPCCADTLFSLLTGTKKLLEAHNIPYFIWAGTLLGAMRDHDIIPYTEDVDIAIHKNGMEKLVKLTSDGSMNFTFYFDKDILRGCETYPIGMQGTRMRTYTQPTYSDTKNRIHDDPTLAYVDVYDVLTEDIWKFLPFQGFGDRTAMMRGQSFAIPAESELYLAKKYRNWETPRELHTYPTDI